MSLSGKRTPLIYFISNKKDGILQIQQDCLQKITTTNMLKEDLYFATNMFILAGFWTSLSVAPYTMEAIPVHDNNGPTL